MTFRARGMRRVLSSFSFLALGVMMGCGGGGGRGSGKSTPPGPASKAREGGSSREARVTKTEDASQAEWDTTLPPPKPPRKKLVVSSTTKGICRAFSRRSRTCIDVLVAQALASFPKTSSVTPRLKQKLKEALLKAITSEKMVRMCQKRVSQARGAGRLGALLKCAKSPTCQGFARCFMNLVKKGSKKRSGFKRSP